MVWPSVFFMHMGVRMKNVSKLTDARVVEKDIPLLD